MAKKEYLIGYDNDNGTYLRYNRAYNNHQTYNSGRIDRFISSLVSKDLTLAYSEKTSAFYAKDRNMIVKFDYSYWDVLDDKKARGERLTSSEEWYYNTLWNFAETCAKRNCINIDNNKTKRKVTRENRYSENKIIAATLAVLLTACIGCSISKYVSEQRLQRALEEEKSIVNEFVISNEEYSSPNEDYVLPSQIEVELPSKEISLEEYINLEKTETNENIVEDTLSSSSAIQSSQTPVFSCDSENLFYTDAVQEKYNQYYSLFCKIAPLYGVSPDLAFAMGMQESGCDHEAMLRKNGPAIGMMQIEKGVFSEGATLVAKKYNPDTNQFEKVVFSNIEENCKDLEYNINFACATFQWNMTNYCGHNPAFGVVCYNMGCGTFSSILKEAASAYGITVDELKANPLDHRWLPFRAGKPGTYDHLERVARFIEPGKTLEFVDPNTLETYTWQFECSSVRDEIHSSTRTN